MSKLRLVIGNKNLSSWSLRPWLLLRQAGIEFDEEVRLFETPGWRDKIGDTSPSGRVPALRHGELLVWDSLAISEYVAELAKPGDASLWPTDPAARAVARAVSAEMHSSFGDLRHDLSMDVTARVPRKTRGHGTERDISRIQAIWEDCRARFGEKATGATGKESGPFLFGRFSVADAMYAPIVWRFRTYDVPFPAENTRAAAWYRMMLDLPAMRAWEADSKAEVEALAAARAADPSAAGAAGKTPDPTTAQHCFAVIFSSQRASHVEAQAAQELERDYAKTDAILEELAKKQPGFLGLESARDEKGFGITVSYWDSLDAVAAWKNNPIHREAQKRGSEFYSRYEIRVCNVERGYKYPA